MMAYFGFLTMIVLVVECMKALFSRFKAPPASYFSKLPKEEQEKIEAEMADTERLLAESKRIIAEAEAVKATIHRDNW